MIRDGFTGNSANGASVKLTELEDVAKTLLLPLGVLLKKLDLIE